MRIFSLTFFSWGVVSFPKQKDEAITHSFICFFACLCFKFVFCLGKTRRLSKMWGEIVVRKNRPAFLTDQENTEELKQHMARVGDKAQRILCSLSFRAWALTLAEVSKKTCSLMMIT